MSTLSLCMIVKNEGALLEKENKKISRGEVLL